MTTTCRRCTVLWVLTTVFASAVFTSPDVKAQPAGESSREALIVYGDAANFQNNGAFDLAAEEWTKFLKKFPNDPLAAKARHYSGVCNLQLKEYKKAADAFAAVIKDHPNFDQLQDAYLNLGWCQYSLAGTDNNGQYAAAAKTFSQMLAKYPQGKYTDQALFFLAESEYHQGKKKEAATSYQKLLDSFANSSLRSDAAYALGVTQEELGKYAEAGKAYDLFLTEFADSDLADEVNMRKAETVLQAGDFKTAEQMFAKVAGIEGFTLVDHALYRQAYCLAEMGKFAEAGALYGKIANDFPNSSNAVESAMSAGRCYYRGEQFDEAAKWLTKVADGGDAAAPEAAHWLCRIHLRNGQPEKVGDLVAKVLPKAGDSPYEVNLRMDQADALYEIPESKPQTVDLYLGIATENPDHELAPQALYNAAFAALELKQYKEGIAHADAFLAKYSEDALAPDVQYVSAECTLLSNQYAEAEAKYRALIDANPKHAESGKWKIRHALSLYLQKDYQAVVDALAAAAPAMKDASNKAEGLFLLGASQFYLDQFDAAVSSLAASLKADSKWRQADETLLYLARAYHKQDDLDKAIETISKMISDFPDSRYLDHAHYRYGEFSYAAEDFATAMTEYTTVVDNFKDSRFAPYAIYGKGWSQLKTEEFSGAAASFTALLDGYKDHALTADALFARAMCHRQAGQSDQAVADVDAYLATKPDADNRADALYERGLAQVALEKYAEAAASFEQVLKTKPDYANADKVLYEWGWALKSQDDAAQQAKAVEAFARLVKEYGDSPLAAEANFHVGESLYDEQEYAKAAAAYAAAKEKSPEGDLGEKTLYKLGWSNFQLKKYAEALEEFNNQLQQFPQGGLQSDALFMKAECLYRQENYEAALSAYEAASKVKLSSTVIEVLALLHGGQSASQLEQWDTAIKLLSQIPEDHDSSPYLAEAHYELGWAKQNQGQQAAAVKDYEEAVAKSRGAVGARAQFMIGEVAFGEKKYADAIRDFQRVMFGFGGDNATEDVKPWQAKAGFDAARCAEVQIQGAAANAKGALIAEAKKFYTYVVEKHPQDKLAAQAKARLAELAKL